MSLFKPINLDEQLISGLKRSLARWQAKTYINSEWKTTNENRRDKNISTIISLLSYYEKNNEFTDAQQTLAKRLIENANQK